MPISWAELDNIAPNGVSMEAALRRIGKEDPWKDLYQIKQRLKRD
jgi:bifunctional non-homologous end joining protein LigD